MIERRRAALACVLATLLAGAGCRAAAPRHPELAAGRHERTMEAAVDGQRLGYVLHVPAAREHPEGGWPLLLFLHGAGERGDDLTRVGVHGPPKLVGEIPELARCVLVSPQCPTEGWWRPRSLIALLDEVGRLVEVDPTRVYVSGLSMGGYGTWELLAHDPGRFAAAVPICGGGDPARLWRDFGAESEFELDDLLRARDVPIRVFHGADDDVVPVEESRLLVRALEEVGADVELVVYAGVGHDSWSRTYADAQLYAWLFAQRRSTD